MTYQEALEKLNKAGQIHVLKYYDELPQAEQKELLDQIDLTDFSVLDSIKNRSDFAKGKISPIGAMELSEIDAHREEFTKLGLDAIKAGKVGAVLLAGGMGTRLGSNDPKGMYDIGLTKQIYIFQRLIENLMDVTKAAGNLIHLFVMTSDKNHDKTVAFLKEKNFFGYDESFVHFFRQEMAPAATYEGCVYMEGKGKIANSPNGNGGWYSSMATSGMKDIVRNSNIEWLNVFAVDNVLQRIADPCFIGATMARKCSVGSKVVRKTCPDEKVGVMCLEDGKPSIVEYYELTDSMKNEKNEKGESAYNFGVILNYLFNVRELDEIAEKKLPLHIVEKKIPYMDEGCNLVSPEKPNGYKFESLILDMIHMMDTCLPYEVVREHEFAPIKNKEGVDSVETARELCRKNGIEL